MSTLAGTFSVIYKVNLQLLQLPEFDASFTIVDHEAYVLDAPCRYQMILGMDSLRKTGIDIKCSENIVEWSGNPCLSRILQLSQKKMGKFVWPTGEWTKTTKISKIILTFDSDDPLDSLWCRLDALYDKMELDEVVSQVANIPQHQTATTTVDGSQEAWSGLWQRFGSLSTQECNSEALCNPIRFPKLKHLVELSIKVYQ